MPRRLYLFEEPDRFTAGTLGPPDDRAFYIQAAKGSLSVTVGIERIQVEALAEHLSELVEEVGRRSLEQRSPSFSASDPLREPVVEAFRVGSLALGWDHDAERIMVEARSPSDQDDADDDDEVGPDLVRVLLRPAEAHAFAARAAEIVAPGRPPCPWCGQPLSQLGHYCTRPTSSLN